MMTPPLILHITRNYLSPELQFILAPFNDVHSTVIKIGTVHLNDMWSEFLATDPEARVRFPALPEKKK
jgi:hypothetical protein